MPKDPPLPAQRPSPSGQARRKFLSALAAAFLLAVPGAIGAALYLWSAPAAAGVPPAAFEVPQGAGAKAVIQSLKARGLIRSKWGFRQLLRVTGNAGSLRAGEFLLSPSQPAREILDVLIRGPLVLRPAVIPEGLAGWQIAARLEAQGLGSAARYKELIYSEDFAQRLGVPASSLEGYLFPSTYNLAKPVDEAKVLANMVDTLRKNLPVDWERLAHEQGLSGLHELLTLASIVEKETGAPAERPAIAGVFLNRLKKNMRLQTDPTVIYGLGENFDGNIRGKDLLADHPYNTYRNKGLPPGPIANPGIEAIAAVLHPSRTPYFYFVARGNGLHYFSRDFKTHEQAVRYYQLRKGKPPPRQEW